MAGALQSFSNEMRSSTVYQNPYADVPEGEKLALFNSAGYLEIAINQGNAAELFGLQGYSELQQQHAQQPFVNNLLLYQTVKIYFE